MDSSLKGTLNLDLAGNVISSTGSLEGTKIAPTIMRMLEEANLLLTNESSPTFKRITVSIVTFKEYEYLITLDKMSIYVYVRARNKEEN